MQSIVYIVLHQRVFGYEAAHAVMVVQVIIGAALLCCLGNKSYLIEIVDNTAPNSTFSMGNMGYHTNYL